MPRVMYFQYSISNLVAATPGYRLICIQFAKYCIVDYVFHDILNNNISQALIGKPDKNGVFFLKCSLISKMGNF